MKALFDFDSGGPSELSFVAGEILTVVERVCVMFILYQYSTAVLFYATATFVS